MKKLELLKELTIMYVESDIKSQAPLGKHLRTIVDNLHIFSSSIEALKSAKKIKPHILITNIKQNRLSGIELIRALKQLNSNMEAIITSESADKKALIDAIRLDVIDFIQKPVDMDMVEKALLKAHTKIIQRQEFIELKRNSIEVNIDDADDNNIFNVFTALQRDEIPVDIINFYKGVPIINTGYVKGVRDKNIFIQTQSIQKLVMSLESSINLESSLLPRPIKLDVADIKSYSEPIKLFNPKIRTFSLRRRKDVRLLPDEDFGLELSVDNHKIAIKIDDVSSELITYTVINIEDKDLLDDGKEIDAFIKFRLDRGGAVEFDFKAAVKIMPRGDKNKIYAIKPLLEGRDKEDYTEYILQREFQIITELKNLRLVNGI